MKAMIFAAGVGSRLAPFTDRHPKALVEVDGKPMLQHVLEHLREAGVVRVVVNVHHFADQITDFLAANNDFGLDIAVSDESALLLDTGGGLLKARPLLEAGNADETILLHNADILTDCPLREMMTQHDAGGADATLLCSRRESSRTLYFSKSDDRLTGWQNLSNGQLKPEGFAVTDDVDPSPFGGVHIVNPSNFPLLEEYAGGADTPFSIVPFYLANLGRLDIRRFMLPGGCRWYDIGSPSKLQAVREGWADHSSATGPTL